MKYKDHPISFVAGTLAILMLFAALAVGSAVYETVEVLGAFAP